MNETYKELSEITSDYVLMVDREGRLQYVNKFTAEQFNLCQSDMIGRYRNEYFPFTSYETESHLIDDLFSNGIPLTTISQATIRKTTKWLSNSYIPLQESNNKTKSVLIVSRDITEIKNKSDKFENAYNKLLELNQMKDRLFAVIAHDLKSPLHSILNFIEIMSEDEEALNPNDRKNIVLSLFKSSTVAVKLLDNLMTWAELLINDSIDVERKEINLFEITQHNIDRVQEEAAKKMLQINNLVDNNLKVFTVRCALNSVIRNLLDNAIKFTHRNGVVQVSAKNIGELVEVTVSDNGVGVQKEHIDEIFKSGYNLNKYGTEGEKGSGLGLILCKGFIQKYGGDIWVESEPEKGSKFKFTLPNTPVMNYEKVEHI